MDVPISEILTMIAAGSSAAVAAVAIGLSLVYFLPLLTADTICCIKSESSTMSSLSCSSPYGSHIVGSWW